MKKTVQSLLSDIAQQLSPVYDSPEQRHSVAQWIIKAITGLSTSGLITAREISLTSEQERTLKNWINKHTQEYMPLQYLIGSVPFCDLSLIVEPPILIPRPETEEWCARLIDQLKPYADKKLTILDLCTGSGCIGLSLAKALPNAHVYLADISEKAVSIARVNARRNGINNVTIVQSDLFNNFPESISFDLIVSNPPYISESDWRALEPSVKEWEDPYALVGGTDGLDLIRKIIKQAPDYLKKDTVLGNDVPHIILEMDTYQGPSILDLFKQAGYKNEKIERDYAGRDRIASARVA